MFIICTLHVDIGRPPDEPSFGTACITFQKSVVEQKTWSIFYISRINAVRNYQTSGGRNAPVAIVIHAKSKKNQPVTKHHRRCQTRRKPSINAKWVSFHITTNASIFFCTPRARYPETKIAANSPLHARAHDMHQIVKDIPARIAKITARSPSIRPEVKRDVLDPLSSRLPSRSSHYPRMRSR